MKKSDVVKNKNLYLFVCVLVLLILYILSFFVTANSKDKRKSIKTALVNSKYEKTISKFQFVKNNEVLFLEKKDDLWQVSKTENPLDFIPADNKKVELFIKDLIKVINMYKISDNLPAKNNFSFDSDQAFTVFYDDFNELLFGGYDFTKTSRYLMTGKNTKVYEIDTNLDKYLSVSIQNWCDPYIIFKSIVNAKPEDVQSVFFKTNDFANRLVPDSKDYLEKVRKLLDLRHGGACETENSGTDGAKAQLELEMGDSSHLILQIFPTKSESVFNVIFLYSSDFTDKKYKFNYKISLWTYNKIKEIML